MFGILFSSDPEKMGSLMSGIESPNMHLTSWEPHEAPELGAVQSYHVTTQSV